MLSWFQNILCYCLTKCSRAYVICPYISKHPMLLFNSIFLCPNRSQFFISKHPMLLFNRKIDCSYQWSSVISKHPMLLFNTDKQHLLPDARPFQNILCYCLTLRSCYQRTVILWFQNILCYCLTIMIIPDQIQIHKFQNILCYCLT